MDHFFKNFYQLYHLYAFINYSFGRNFLKLYILENLKHIFKGSFGKKIETFINF